MAECTHGGDIHMDRHSHGGVYVLYTGRIVHTVDCTHCGVCIGSSVYTFQIYTRRERHTHGGDTDTKGTYTRMGRTHGHTHGGDVHTDETSTQRGYTHGGDVCP